MEGGSHGAIEEAIRHDGAFAAAVMEFLASGKTAGLPRAVILPEIDWVVPN